MPSKAAPPLTPETKWGFAPSAVTTAPLAPTDRHSVDVGQATLRRMLGVESGAPWSTSRGAAQRTGAVPAAGAAGAAGASVRPHATATSAHSVRIIMVALMVSAHRNVRRPRQLR